jgi:hypothetical protein
MGVLAGAFVGAAAARRTLSAQRFTEGAEQGAPMFSQAHLRGGKRKAVAGCVILRDRVPAAMLDGDARFLIHGFESDIDVRDLVGRKRRLAPGESKPFAWRPSCDTADLEVFAVGQRRDEATILAWLEAQRAVAARRELEQAAGPPPGCDLLRENVKRLFGRRFHAKRYDNGAHFRFFSTCALKEAS